MEENDIIHLKRKQRFIPLKNPLNLIPNLTENHFKTLCTSFYQEIEHNINEEEKQFDKTITMYHKEIKDLHQKIKESYKNLFQFMLNNLYDDTNKQLLEAISLMLEHPEYAEGFAEIIKNSIRFINEGKRPALIHDSCQYVYGTKPLYFDFKE